MKKKYWLLSCFVLLALVQIALCASLVAKWEDILRTGSRYRFRAEPVDPYDAFRGRYVSLAYQAGTVPVGLGSELKRGDEVYARLEKDREGFARISRIERKEPAGGDYVLAEVSWVNTRKREARLKLPFNRYYMEEKIAPAAERAYRKHSRADKVDAYVTVRVKNGYGVIEELYIAGKPIREYLREERKTDITD